MTIKNTSQWIMASLAFILLATSFSLKAQQWEAPGDGSINYPSGRTESFKFGFSFQKTFDTHVFSAGKAKLRTDEPPPNYRLNAVINKEGLIYIAEFANGFFKSFELNIGGHYVAIKPRRDFEEEQPYKHLVILVDDKSYLVDATHPAINFEFNDSGISDISGVGVIRDLSSRRR
ncbi:hypothetical protein LG288_07590 [Idiomarina seosinensis]|uniref:hypothetical protein n=1 Tax=Idiomarina seosinensis TaxID=281739 RepID=UPI00384CE927